ncbi:ubiquinone biosynthesis hydroxylase [Thiobacillus denitrificans ATCC 25259]|uniref:Ubiquinone biosynthesis hydroxylase n=1 Tax=Thiobacillus denitrificans (strain ATCC 25259 / T1) TaxID=292415 RepID=Q3SGG4_THIDA|nr:FAD-dependent monooxygenase [Thiobacillus denitrificans]AAZ98286.1 ubiquinone biosynthesis hydroxylase [Thiobacillus denitrificans ATCC 25259]
MNEVIVVGAGPVGAVSALALQQHGVAARVLEARAEDARADTRTLALAHGARLILERLGVWARVQDVTPITRIHISQRGALGVTRLSAEALGVPALGYVLSYAHLTEVLKQALAEAPIAVEYGVPVERIEPGIEAACVQAADGRTWSAPLVAVADGGRGTQTPAPRFAHDYAQTAVVCEVRTELAHGGQAFERFTPEGPAALLPKRDGYALVWTAASAEAMRIAALSDAEFLAALQRHFGGRQGLFLAATPRKTFPLHCVYAGREVGARVVRIGNAAQTLHPVAGQGFNIGLRDAWELARLCADTPATALGGEAMLHAYARGRRFDVVAGLGFTDFLVRMFSNDVAVLRHARGLGLLALEALPPLKAFVARRMMFGARG